MESAGEHDLDTICPTMDMEDMEDSNKLTNFTLQELIVCVGMEVVVALEYLHDEKHMVHGNINAFNVVFTHESHIKLVDFGNSKDLRRVDQPYSDVRLSKICSKLLELNLI